MNNKEYIETLRKDPEIQRVMAHQGKDYGDIDIDDPRHVSGADVVYGVIDIDQRVGDSRIYNYMIKPYYEIDEGSYCIEECGEFYGLVHEFSETILNSNWEPNEDWLVEKDYSDEEYVF